MESNDAPHEPGDSEMVEAAAGRDADPTLPALIADTCSSMLDAVAIIDRIEAKQDAWKVEFLDQARRIAETTKRA